MGKPGGGNAPSAFHESIVECGEPGELKHLSSRRKRKKIFDFLSSGERKGKSPNRSSTELRGCGPAEVEAPIVEERWKTLPKRVMAP